MGILVGHLLRAREEWGGRLLEASVEGIPAHVRKLSSCYLEPLYFFPQCLVQSCTRRPWSSCDMNVEREYNNHQFVNVYRPCTWHAHSLIKLTQDACNITCHSLRWKSDRRGLIVNIRKFCSLCSLVSLQVMKDKRHTITKMSLLLHSLQPQLEFSVLTSQSSSIPLWYKVWFQENFASNVSRNHIIKRKT